MIVMQLIEHQLEFLSLKEGYTGTLLEVTCQCWIPAFKEKFIVSLLSIYEALEPGQKNCHLVTSLLLHHLEVAM